MKLSVSLIATTLAVITGSVIASPGPLHARALEQVNSFKRDLDVFSREARVDVLEREVDGEPLDNLFTRRNYRDDHLGAVNDLAKAANAQRLAARKAKCAAHVHPNPSKTRTEWLKKAETYAKFASELERKAHTHKLVASYPTKTKLHDNVEDDKRFAKNLHAQAQNAIPTAEHPVNNRYQLPPGWKVKSILE